MKALHLMAAAVLLSLTAGCATRTPDTEADLLRLAVKAISRNDWRQYSELAVTPSDFIRLRSKMTPLAFQQSYAGSVIKPEEEKRQREDFDRAAGLSVAGTPIQNARYAGPGSMAEPGEIELLDGGAVAYTLFSLKIKAGGIVVDTKDIPLLFRVVKWGEQYRIIKLVVSPAPGKVF